MYLILWGLKTWAIAQGDNRTALSYAALGGHVEVVDALLAEGANMEAKTKVLPGHGSVLVKPVVRGETFSLDKKSSDSVWNHAPKLSFKLKCVSLSPVEFQSVQLCWKFLISCFEQPWYAGT